MDTHLTLPATRMGRLNITFAGSNGDLGDFVAMDASDADIKAWATEAVRSGSVPGIAQAQADFTNFVVERFNAEGDLPDRVFLRPKTAYGA